MIAIPIIIPIVSLFCIDGNLKIMDACCTCNHQLLIICSNKKYPPFDINFKLRLYNAAPPIKVNKLFRIRYDTQLLA